MLGCAEFQRAGVPLVIRADTTEYAKPLLSAASRRTSLPIKVPPKFGAKPRKPSQNYEPSKLVPFDAKNTKTEGNGVEADLSSRN